MCVVRSWEWKGGATGGVINVGFESWKARCREDHAQWMQKPVGPPGFEAEVNGFVLLLQGERWG